MTVTLLRHMDGHGWYRRAASGVMRGIGPSDPLDAGLDVGRHGRTPIGVKETR